MTQPYISATVMLAFIVVWVCAFIAGWLVCSWLRDAKEADKPRGEGNCDMCQFGKRCTQESATQCYMHGMYTGYEKKE